MLEQGNSSLSQSVTVYPALPRQPAGDLLATVRRMMMNGYIRDVEDGDEDHHHMKTCQDEVSPGTRDGKTLQQ